MFGLLNIFFSCKGILKLNVSTSCIPRQIAAAWMIWHADFYHSKKKKNQSEKQAYIYIRMWCVIFNSRSFFDIWDTAVRLFKCVVNDKKVMNINKYCVKHILSLWQIPLKLGKPLVKRLVKNYVWYALGTTCSGS